MTATRSTNSTDREIATDDLATHGYLAMYVDQDGEATFGAYADGKLVEFTLRPVEMHAFIRFYQERVDNE